MKFIVICLILVTSTNLFSQFTIISQTDNMVELEAKELDFFYSTYTIKKKKNNYYTINLITPKKIDVISKKIFPDLNIEQLLIDKYVFECNKELFNVKTRYFSYSYSFPYITFSFETNNVADSNLVKTKFMEALNSTTENSNDTAFLSDYYFQLSQTNINQLKDVIVKNNLIGYYHPYIEFLVNKNGEVISVNSSRYNLNNDSATTYDLVDLKDQFYMIEMPTVKLNGTPINYRYSLSEDIYREVLYNDLREKVNILSPGVHKLQEYSNLFFIKNKLDGMNYIIDMTAKNNWYNMYELYGESSFEMIKYKDIDNDGKLDIYYDNTDTYNPNYTNRIYFKYDTILTNSSFSFTKELPNGMYYSLDENEYYYSERVFNLNNYYNEVFVISKTLDNEKNYEDEYYDPCSDKSYKKPLKKQKKYYYYIYDALQNSMYYSGYSKGKGEKAIKKAKLIIQKYFN